MSPQHLLLRQALGACSAHVVFRHRFNDRRTRDPCEDGGLNGCQCDGRQYQCCSACPQAATIFLRPARKSARTDPLKVHCKKQDQQNGQPKIRQSQTQLAECHHAYIALGILFGGGIHTQTQGHEDGDAHGHDGQWQGDVHALHHEHRCGRVVRNTHTRLALKQATHPFNIPREGRLVQTQFFFHGCQRFWGGGFAQNNLRSIAWQPFQHPKYHHRRDRQGGEKTEETLKHKRRHALSLCLQGWRPISPVGKTGRGH